LYVFPRKRSNSCGNHFTVTSNILQQKDHLGPR
jgi:hypothetical protein